MVLNIDQLLINPFFLLQNNILVKNGLFRRHLAIDQGPLMNYVTLLLSFYLLSPSYTMATMGLYNPFPLLR